jgi:hypothetical protein
MTHISHEQNVMSSHDPIGSAPPERPRDPTHFGGEGLYEPLADTDKSVDRVADSSLKVPLGEQLEDPMKDALGAARSTKDSLWDFARRKHVPALLAAGVVVWLLGVLIRRSTRP